LYKAREDAHRQKLRGGRGAQENWGGRPSLENWGRTTHHLEKLGAQEERANTF